MTKAPLTLAAIRAMSPGQTLWDHVVTGLHVRRRGDKTTFNLYYKSHAGDRRTPKLGNWPQLTLELARDAARDLLAQVATGRDPSAAKREAREAPTVADLAAEWFARKAPPVKSELSLSLDRGMLANHVLPHLGAARVREVQSGDIRRIIDRVADTSGDTAAASVRRLLSSMFNLAEHFELAWRPRNSNPVRDVPAPHLNKRNVYITPAEFERLAPQLEALRDRWPMHVACIWVALYCGTRITELATARTFQLHGSQLILDRHKTERTGQQRIIRLSRAARDELERLPLSSNGFIFGDLGAQGPAARGSLHYVFSLARKAAGCEHIRLQDLRRTFASVAKSRGVGLSQIGELFSHTNTQTTLRYAWLYDDAAQSAADAVADEIRNLAKKG